MAPSTTRSPAAAAASDFVQKADAASGASGCMKLTEAPLATASIRASVRAEITVGVGWRGTMSTALSMSCSNMSCSNMSCSNMSCSNTARPLHANALSYVAVEIDRDRVAAAHQDADAFAGPRLVAA